MMVHCNGTVIRIGIIPKIPCILRIDYRSQIPRNHPLIQTVHHLTEIMTMKSIFDGEIRGIPRGKVIKIHRDSNFVMIAISRSDRGRSGGNIERIIIVTLNRLFVMFVRRGRIGNSMGHGVVSTITLKETMIRNGDINVMFV